MLPYFYYSNLLLISSKTQATMHCQVCGIGEYKKLTYDEYYDHPKFQPTIFLDTQKLISTNDTNEYHPKAPTNFNQNNTPYLAKCYTAQIFYTLMAYAIN